MNETTAVENTDDRRTAEAETAPNSGAKKIISLDVANVMRVKAVHLDFDPDGGLTIIGGKNDQGKTSVLKALEFALGGKSAIVDEPLTHGEKKGHVIVELDDMVVTRTFKGDGKTALEVRGKDGRAWPSPQSMLNELLGRLSFDPLAFANMKPAERLETLKSVVGLDFSGLDARRKELYDQRTIINRDLKNLHGQLSAMPHHPNLGVVETSLTAITQELETAEEHNRTNAEKHREAMEALDEYKQMQTEAESSAQAFADRIAEIDAEIERLRRRRADIAQEAEVRQGGYRTALAQLKQTADALAEQVAQLEDIDTVPIRQKLETAEEHNKRIRENQAYAKCQQRIDALEQESADLTEQIEDIDAEKQRRIGAIEMPIEGLGFDDTGVRLRGVPFEQAGKREQLVASVAMGLAMNKGLNVMLIDDGERADLDGLKVIADMARKAGAQVIMTRVSEGDECTVIIEDGRIRTGT